MALARLLLAALVIAALVLVFYHPSKHHAAPPAVSVTSVGHPILGVTASWELFGLTSRGMVSVQFAHGQITRTVLPPALGDGLVSFIVAPHQAIVRPLANVRGYLVPDGQPPRPLTGILAGGGLLLPGPAPGEEWFVDGLEAVTLVGPAGQPTGVRIATAAQRWPAQSAMADGRGDVLLFNDSGVLYDTGPGLLRQVGMLLAAVGPRSWLGLDCARTGCRNVVVNAATDARRTLPGAALNVVTWPWPAQPGVIAPDGSFAAVRVAPRAMDVALDLVNLRTGAVTTIPVAVDPASSSRTLAWSPDSRWLFVITANGGLVAVSPRDGSVHSLGIPLPGLSQIAMRGASG
ncbi:MAG TPA: hypothetical protein VGH96_09020 [Streptosporangiaceae bacterium]|jgi:hypothetical protein